MAGKPKQREQTFLGLLKLFSQFQGWELGHKFTLQSGVGNAKLIWNG
jgi:hypothetical protein